MNEASFRRSLLLIALCFSALFVVLASLFVQSELTLWPLLWEGLANPVMAMISVDVVLCWLVLAAWVLYERRCYSIRWGWMALLLGIVPGVAVGFALYLLLRHSQLKGSGLP